MRWSRSFFYSLFFCKIMHLYVKVYRYSWVLMIHMLFTI